jgi:hypothetical protein
MSTFKFDVVKEIAILGENHSGQIKRLRVVSWNGRAPALDLRLWYGENQPGKGMALTDAEAVLLRDALVTLDLHDEEATADSPANSPETAEE